VFVSSLVPSFSKGVVIFVMSIMTIAFLYGFALVFFGFRKNSVGQQLSFSP